MPALPFSLATERLVLRRYWPDDAAWYAGGVLCLVAGGLSLAVGRARRAPAAASSRSVSAM